MKILLLLFSVIFSHSVFAQDVKLAETIEKLLQR